MPSWIVAHFHSSLSVSVSNTWVGGELPPRVCHCLLSFSMAAVVRLAYVSTCRHAGRWGPLAATSVSRLSASLVAGHFKRFRYASLKALWGYYSSVNRPYAFLCECWVRGLSLAFLLC